MLARNQAVNELEKELAVSPQAFLCGLEPSLRLSLQTSYPPRDVRGFRVLRVRDARLSDANGKTKAARTAQLTVWDANTLGADFFQPHQRYLVSALEPSSVAHTKFRNGNSSRTSCRKDRGSARALSSRSQLGVTPGGVRLSDSLACMVDVVICLASVVDSLHLHIVSILVDTRREGPRCKPWL